MILKIGRGKIDVLPILMIIPAIVVLGFIWGFPIVKLFQLSTLEWYLSRPLLKTYIGVKNMLALFRDGYFHHALRVTGIYMGVAVACELGIGLLVASRLNAIEKGRLLYVTLFLIPMIMSPVVVALFWRAWAAPEFGLIGYFMNLVKLGNLFPPEGLTGTNRAALPTIIFVDIWEWAPFMILILYSGLQSLPKEPFEAIALDGANRLQIFVHLTLPMLRPVILVALLFRTIDAYRAFDVIWIMTRGGPGRVTENLAVFTYKTGFREWNVGYSAASGVIMLIGALIISFALVRRVSKT
jgi:multiple sugar transport system permease protein